MTRTLAHAALLALPEDERAEVIAEVTRTLTLGRGKIVTAAYASMSLEVEVIKRVPALDASTAYEVSVFLHWLAITLQRVHDVKRDPYWCFADVQESANTSVNAQCVMVSPFEVAP